jgi:hypothetical protein
LSETDRLSATIQTDQEESEIFIRSQEVRDRSKRLVWVSMLGLMSDRPQLLES